MVEFGRVPAVCQRPILCSGTRRATPDTLLACLECSLRLGTAAELCGHDSLGSADQFGGLAFADAKPRRDQAQG